MTTIDRTAYPRFRATLTPTELYAHFTPTTKELALAEACVNIAFHSVQPVSPPALQPPHRFFARFPDPAQARLFLKRHGK